MLANHSLSCENFRGIAISPVIAKVFEYCFLQKFGDYLYTDSKQFGFKKGMGCNHAINTVRCVIEQLTKGGNTVNLCAIDLSKAFDKVNHHALLIKLMKRKLPVILLELLENWLQNCFSCIKWTHVLSATFQIRFGVRQGSVLSPFLFAIYLDDIPIFRSLLPRSFVVLYADDILLIAPSVSELQELFDACAIELSWLDMNINEKKSCCIRIGPRWDVRCRSIKTSNGHIIPWVTEFRYLGTYIVGGRTFKCSTTHAKRSFHRAINAIFGKIGRLASEEV